MVESLLAQILSIIVMNWTFFITLQGIVIFRRMLLSLWKKTAFVISGIFLGICSSILFVVSIMLTVAFVYGREGGFYLSEYQSNRVFPLVSIICLEFAEIMVYLFKAYIVRKTSLNVARTDKEEFKEEDRNTYFSIFKKPNLAMLQ